MSVVVDSHAHLDVRMLDLAPLVAKLDAAGVDRVALIPPLNDPLPHTPERLLAAVRVLMQSAPGRLLAEGIHRTTITRQGHLRLSGHVYEIYPFPDNGVVARALEQHPDRFLGWIFLNPRHAGPEAALEELERWRAVPGMVGIKLHPHWHDYPTKRLDPILKRAEELRLPVLIHLGFRKRGDIWTLAERFPRLRIICAHAGVPFYQKLWKLARRRDNLFVDLSSPYIDEKLARAAVAAVGPQRCLYGTDSPYGFPEADHTYDYGRILGWVERMPLRSEERERVLGGNFLELITRSS